MSESEDWDSKPAEKKKKSRRARRKKASQKKSKEQTDATLLENQEQERKHDRQPEQTEREEQEEEEPEQHEEPTVRQAAVSSREQPQEQTLAPPPRVSRPLPAIPSSVLLSGEICHNTAVVITPPDDIAEVIQRIRRRLDTHHVDIWPPHVTLFYPFYPPTQLEVAQQSLQQIAANVQPFKVRLANFGNFSQGAKGYVTWLSPDPNPAVVSLRQRLQKAVPGCDATFKQPHLTVARGQPTSQEGSLRGSWVPVEFMCESLTVLQRTHAKAPMRPIGVIHLGSSPSSSTTSSSSSFASLIPRSVGSSTPFALPVATATPVAVASSPLAQALEEKKGVAAPSSSSSLIVRPLEHLVLEQTSSCVIMPPWQQWKPFVDLKQRHMKPSIKRPPYPHITMFAPFAARRDFGEVKAALCSLFAKEGIRPFEVVLDTFEVFQNRNNSTLYLKPRDNPAGSLEKLHYAIKKILPRGSSYSFDSHIGIGFFERHAEAVKLRAEYQAGWRPISFSINEVYLLNRQGSSVPWDICTAVPLEGYQGPSAFKLGSRTSLPEQQASA